MKVITLTTDFGTRDWFVGVMKGVILGIAPSAEIVDLTHEIPPGDIRAGAFALKAAAPYFPSGTIHVVVIDPGVGSARRALAIRTRRYSFLAPDNGLLSLAAPRETVQDARELTNTDLFLPDISRTFHGRDVFAPAAAHLAKGLSFCHVGPKCVDYAQLDWPKPAVSRDQIQGEVLYVDRFGNAMTNIVKGVLPTSTALSVWRGRTRLCSVESCYSAVRKGCPVAVVGSTGFLEIAVNGGSAARKLKLKPGTHLAVRPS